MQDLEELIKKMRDKTEELKAKIYELDNSILIDPHTPESTKEQIRQNRKMMEREESNDGVQITNKIIGFDPGTFNHIY